MPINPFTKDPPIGGDVRIPSRDRTKEELNLARSKTILAAMNGSGVFGAVHLILFREKALSPNLEENLKAARWSLFLTHGVSLILASFVLYQSVLYGSVCVLVCAASFAYLWRVYRTCAAILREDEVRQVMES